MSASHFAWITGHAMHPSCENCMTAQYVYIRKEHYYAHSCSLLKDNISKDSIWTLKGNLKALTMLYLRAYSTMFTQLLCTLCMFRVNSSKRMYSTMLLLKYSISPYKKAEPILYSTYLMRLRFEVAKIRSVHSFHHNDHIIIIRFCTAFWRIVPWVYFLIGCLF